MGEGLKRARAATRATRAPAGNYRDPSKVIAAVIRALDGAHGKEGPVARSLALDAFRALLASRTTFAYDAPEIRAPLLWSEGARILSMYAPLPPTDPACPEAWREVARIWTGK